jgi:uncharacterized protein YqfA (UPF0365 family)
MGVYGQEHRTRFTDVSRSFILAAADVPTTVGAAIIAGRAKYTIFVQRIAVNVRTAAAQVLTFQDTAGTPKVIATLGASAAAGNAHVLLDEPEGVPLTEGTNLDLTGAAGVAGTITITGYLKPTGTLLPSQI